MHRIYEAEPQGTHVSMGGQLARSIKRQHQGLSGRVHSIRCNMKKLNKKHDIEAFIIDGLDDCLSILTGKEVRLVTFTTDTYEIPKR